MRHGFALKSQDPPLDTVSTTCDSRWVRSRSGLKAAHPPATAGGTDPIQVRLLTFEAKPCGMNDHWK